MIDELLTDFRSIITTHNLLINRLDTHIIHHKGRIVFSDTSILVYTDISILSEKRRKYAYQWMNSDETLRIRWDNADHHPHISSYPYHLHVGNDDHIEASKEMTLQIVLSYIALQITSHS
jgi:Family of unknown function (DUF6516)